MNDPTAASAIADHALTIIPYYCDGDDCPLTLYSSINASVSSASCSGRRMPQRMSGNDGMSSVNSQSLSIRTESFGNWLKSKPKPRLLVSKCMVKKQQMRCSESGAYILLQVRTKVLNTTNYALGLAIQP